MFIVLGLLRRVMVAEDGGRRGTSAGCWLSLLDQGRKGLLLRRLLDFPIALVRDDLFQVWWMSSLQGKRSYRWLIQSLRSCELWLWYNLVW